MRINVLCKMFSAPPAEAVEEALNILRSDLVATQNNVGWGGVAGRALDGNSNGQWSAGYVIFYHTH